LDQLDADRGLRRIRTDVLSDLILAPHYSAIFEHAGDELRDRLFDQLRSGDFEPSLPIYIEAPKANGIPRPGAILPPLDRLAYQLLADHVAPLGEAQLDRTRVHSHVLLEPDPDGRMFRPGHESWQQLRDSLVGFASAEEHAFVVRADVASFFDRLYQHNLINLLHASGAAPGAVNLLEKLLSAWRQKDSHGILQGMFPSDFLGNFYLCALDGHFEIQGTPSARFVDDIYLFYGSEIDARKGLTELARILRAEGLHLNERKTEIVASDALIHEETALDRLFDEAKDELDGYNWVSAVYGFVTAWRIPDDLSEREDIDEDGEAEIEGVGRLAAVELLYDRVDDEDAPVDRIERFCLPLLGASGSQRAIERAVRGIVRRPHLAQLYSSYLMKVARDNEEVTQQLEREFEFGTLAYDWQLMWLLGTLTYLGGVSRASVNRALRIAQDHSVPVPVRAMAVQLAARHGNVAQRRAVRTLYTAEPSEYVRASILFASRHFPTPERRTCLGAWGGHSDVNALTVRAVNALT
jgi:hypothetical protein